MARQGQGRLLFALFLLVLVGLEFPVAAIVEAVQRSTGMPVLPFYVFGIWLLAIVGAALILERRGR
jgi:hypothetical protein